MAISRVASIVGETNVCVPEWRGGRDPGQQYVLVPAAQVDLANVDANLQRVTPGALHPKEWSGDVGVHVPCETILPPEQVEVLGADGFAVGVTGRHHFTSHPHSIRRQGKVFRITTWFGPWPVEERWWDPTRQRRMVRMQCRVSPEDHTARKDNTVKEEAWLLSLEQKKWFIIGVYS
jgi:protein ImuB